MIKRRIASNVGPALAAVILGYSSTTWAGHLDAVQQELDAQRQQWQTSNVDDYTFRFERICFCPREWTNLGTVSVVGGQLESVQDRVSGDLLDPAFYLSVDQLFDEVQAAIDSDAYEIAVQYDNIFGYPTSIDVDFVELAIDEEVSFRVSDLRLVPEPQSFVLLSVGLCLVMLADRKGQLGCGRRFGSGP